MTTEEYIRDCAARGYSKTMVLETLGICRYSFYAMLEAMAPIDWPGRGQSLACKLANEARRGISTQKIRDASKKAHAAVRAKHLKTVDGVQGSVEELARMYSVSASTVRRRVKAGMTLEEALKTPITPVAQHRKGFNERFISA
ncbi:hypothetical protein [Pseudomonas sp. PNPG3]|uniref:hypothetical protein n=1 Tax=Pseudomonas sp. PNPG3 TaxID=2919497 RepID=UPI001FFCF01A|nr:hypothetical protein [Pseudomonas sp. PNPG3]MCK2122156.1 hypothetical protein [Pseudomonas sp. PNPG3]